MRAASGACHYRVCRRFRTWHTQRAALANRNTGRNSHSARLPFRHPSAVYCCSVPTATGAVPHAGCGKPHRSSSLRAEGLHALPTICYMSVISLSNSITRLMLLISHCSSLTPLARSWSLATRCTRPRHEAGLRPRASPSPRRFQTRPQPCAGSPAAPGHRRSHGRLPSPHAPSSGRYRPPP